MAERCLAGCISLSSLEALPSLAPSLPVLAKPIRAPKEKSDDLQLRVGFRFAAGRQTDMGQPCIANHIQIGLKRAP